MSKDNLRRRDGRVVDVAVFGDNTIDTVYMTDSGCAPGGKAKAHEVHTFAGGPAANVAFTLARLGLSTSYIGSFGDNPGGSTSWNSLSEAGCDLEDSAILAGVPQHTATVIVDRLRGERTIVECKNDRLLSDARTFDPSVLSGVRAVYLDAHEIDFAVVVARAARAGSIHIFSDLENADGPVDSLLECVDELVAPLDVLMTLTGERMPGNAIERALDRGPRVVIGTAGAKGSVGARAGGDLITVPAATCQVRDSTGAGDAFHAGFVAARLAGWQLRQALDIATRIAAAKCETLGPRIDARRLAGFEAELHGRPTATGEQNEAQRASLSRRELGKETSCTT
jgi:sulfofructose kinase